MWQRKAVFTLSWKIQLVVSKNSFVKCSTYKLGTFFFFPGSLLSFLSHDESRCILSYSDYFLFEHSVIRGWNRKNPLFFSFNWSQMVARPGLIGCWLSTATPSTVRTQNQKCGPSGSHDPELCSITFTCLCDLWISISSNELAMTRQNPHCF